MNDLLLVEVVNLIRQQIELCGNSQKTVAFNLGISPQYLSDILRYRREPGAKLLKAMGLRKRIVYQRVLDATSG